MEGGEREGGMTGRAVAGTGERRKRGERRVWQEETRRRVIENGRDKQERCAGGDADKCATRGGRWDRRCKEMLMICILMRWQFASPQATLGAHTLAVVGDDSEESWRCGEQSRENNNTVGHGPEKKRAMAEI